MKLVCYELDLSIEFRENNIQVLILESPTIFQKVISDLYLQITNNAGPYVLSEDIKELDMSKNVELILSPYDISFENRKIISGLYSHLSDIVNEDLVGKLEINGILCNYLDNLILHSKYPFLDINVDPKWENLFKMYEIKPIKQFDSLLEQVIEYLKLSSTILNTKMFIFIGLKQFFDETQLLELYKMIQLLKVNVLLIERTDLGYNPFEEVRVIDQDFCLIVK